MSEFLDLSPSPSALMESLRDIGYSMDTAIADIIDNSITAKGKRIDIRFSYNSGRHWLAIIDNGTGMSRDELHNAMRFGSQHPQEIRSPDDLGRFGLGLKTATLSQCRILTVLSKQNEEVNCCEWDMNRILNSEKPGWVIRLLDNYDLEKKTALFRLYEDYLKDLDSGTIVFWEDFDRLESCGNKKEDEDFFNNIIFETRKHLELVFHRFLSPDPGDSKRKIRIFMNGDELDAFNPFNPKHSATQELQLQEISIQDQKISVQPYVLPHYSKVSADEYKKYSGESGYLHNQGYYVYRNKRLIIKGTWFKLIRKEELNKLIRVRVDIPNTLDHIWKIDVKKSQADLPPVIRKELRKIINRIEDKGKKVYRKRGTTLRSTVNYPIWNRKASENQVKYEINRDHPFVLSLMSSLEAQLKNQVKQLLSIVESSFPKDLFYQDISNDPDKLKQPTINKREYRRLAKLFIDTWKNNGVDDGEIGKRLLNTDPFILNRDLTLEILEEMELLNG